MNFVKHFCRLITQVELDNDQVMEYFDIVQSISPTKIVKAYSEDGESISADVTVYSADDNESIYEIVLEDQLNLEEGEAISDELNAELNDIDFEFETSLEI
jgi:hypothetical protein|tara:strand:+ start:153 stop:455 length:303 start_codon:yes stop_codon:yes gene_type:complete